MNQGYTDNYIKVQVAADMNYENKLLEVTLNSVDVIVGFPGEEEEDFLATQSFLKNLDISYLHVFTFSDRVNTEAASLNNKVSKEEKTYRSKTMHMISDEKRFEFHEKSLKQIRPVLFEQSVNGINQGYTDNYIKVQVAADMNYENKLIPDCSIGVDVIVGFPGEEEEDFLATQSFLKNLDISYLHVFTFSDRVNTEAASLNNKVSKEEKTYRSKTMHMISDEKRFEFHEKSLKQIRPVLFEQSVNGTNQGYTDNYIKVQVAADMNYENKLLEVTLNKKHGSYMSGLFKE
jgi:tRNA A37 methylthiotransferase MiaB